MNTYLYARVSTDEDLWQDPDRQLTPLREYCKLMGIEINGEFIDRLSGQEKQRPEFRRMLFTAETMALHERSKGSIGNSQIICYSIDRLARFKARETLYLLDKLVERGVYVKSLTESYVDTQSPNWEELEPLVYLKLYFSRKEVKLISERVKSGIANKRAKHEWKGGRPKGKKDSKPRTRRYKKKPTVEVEDMFTKSS